MSNYQILSGIYYVYQILSNIYLHNSSHGGTMNFLMDFGGWFNDSRHKLLLLPNLYVTNSSSLLVCMLPNKTMEVFVTNVNVAKHKLHSFQPNSFPTFP